VATAATAVCLPAQAANQHSVNLRPDHKVPLTPRTFHGAHAVKHHVCVALVAQLDVPPLSCTHTQQRTQQQQQTKRQSASRRIDTQGSSQETARTQPQPSSTTPTQQQPPAPSFLKM
jgi:hypothetical protein